MVVKLPPNTRLKLTAPVGYGRIPFVIIVAPLGGSTCQGELREPER